MGIHLGKPRTKRISSMANLWPAHVIASMALDREWKRWRDTTDSSFLDSADIDVCFKFRTGGLGTA